MNLDPNEAFRRFLAWKSDFERRVGVPDSAIVATAAQVIQLPPVTVTEAARLLNIPGSTPAAKAQKLRRLEASGKILRAHRSRVHGDRFWFGEELAELIAGAA